MNTDPLPVFTILKRIFLGFALLVLAGACLYWQLAPTEGWMVALMFGPFSALIALAGAIALGVALFIRWLPRRAGWTAAGVVLWVLTPIIGGPLLALYLPAIFDVYYQSPYYARWYNAWSGLTVAPQAQRFHYADCSLDGYTATYQITALRDTELGFVLLDRNDLRAVDTAQDVAQSIGSQFAFVRDAPYFFSEGDGELGVYRVPAGEHTLMVQARSPFQLGILDAVPLWAPNTWPEGERRAHTIYADDHTWEELVAAAAPFRAADCTPTCTRLNVPPPSEALNNVPNEQRASIGAVIGERPVDADGDSYFDTLDISVTLQVTTTGDYLLQGALRAPDGLTLARASYQSPYPAPFCSGAHTVTLRFDGKTLHDSGADGPYRLDGLVLAYLEPGGTLASPEPPLTTADLIALSDRLGVPIEDLGQLYLPAAGTAEGVYTTAPYTRWQFAGEPHKPFDAAGRVEDWNGNDLFDRLVVDAIFYGLRPTLYRWTGVLRGASGCEAGAAEGGDFLNDATAATFAFPSGPIRRSRCDGPYTLANVTVTADDGSQQTATYDNVHTTPAYRAVDFDPLPVKIGQCAHPGQPSRNDNERYDRLAISASVQGLDLPDGEYEWSGSLLAPGGALIDTAAGGGQLATDGAIDLTFSGAAIRRLGVDGPYTLGNVTITSRTAPSTTITLPALCNTDELAVWQFAP